MQVNLQTAQRVFPKAFQGPHAKMNEALVRQLSYYVVPGDIRAIRKGIAVLESPFKKNFDTTTERVLYTLDDKGGLVCLKRKAIYHREPSASDTRSISGKWSYSEKTKEMEHISSVSRGGKLLTKERAVEANGSNNVVEQFYWLPNGRMKFFEKYDFQAGTYQRIIKDTTGNRGIYGEHGRLVFKDGKATTETIKDGSFTYNENIGGVVRVQRPKENFRLPDFFAMLESVYNKKIQDAVRMHLIG